MWLFYIPALIIFGLIVLWYISPIILFFKTKNNNVKAFCANLICAYPFSLFCILNSEADTISVIFQLPFLPIIGHLYLLLPVLITPIAMIPFIIANLAFGLIFLANIKLKLSLVKITFIGSIGFWLILALSVHIITPNVLINKAKAQFGNEYCNLEQEKPIIMFKDSLHVNKFKQYATVLTPKGSYNWSFKQNKWTPNTFRNIYKFKTDKEYDIHWKNEYLKCIAKK